MVPDLLVNDSEVNYEGLEFPVSLNNGANYAYVKETLKKLRDRSMWMTLEDGSETVVGWLDRVTTNKKSGLAHIRIDDRLIPYLFDLAHPLP